MTTHQEESQPRGGFETALHHLTQEILDGNVGAGTRLPGERELSEKLGVSRGAVREAMKVLQTQGIVTSQVGPGRGTRVASTQGPAFGRILRLHVALHAISFDELTDTRVLLERAATLSAATTMEDHTLDTLDKLCEDMEAVSDIDPFNELDTAFHVEIARAGNNRLVRDLTVAIREAVAGHILSAEHSVVGWDELRLSLVREHRGIVAALRLGDGELAAALAERHVRGAHAALLPH